MSFFDKVPQIPEDPIFGLTEEFKKDPRKEKWNLSIGVYRDEQLKPVVLRTVKEAERRLIEKETSKEYLPIDGSAGFLEKIGRFAFGNSFWNQQASCVSTAQTAGGTNALRLGADVIKNYISDRILISDPTWPNHPGIFNRVGFSVEKYPYYDLNNAAISWEKMRGVLTNAAEKTVVLLQPCCHNPSGMNLNMQQWKEIASIIKEKKLIPFFDFAYQGFGQGFEKDPAALRPFIESGQEFFLAYSCSKNFSLYCERTGALFVVASSEKEKQRIQSVLKSLIRNNISNPPAHGVRIVEEILSDQVLEEKWKEEVEQMRQRIMFLRNQVSQMLNLPHIARAEGMFGYLHLSSSEVERIKKDAGIYMTSDSRINLAALNEEVLKRLKNAIR
jgi:aspartate/tyrosine/aromatic aminotransferase